MLVRNFKSICLGGLVSAGFVFAVINVAAGKQEAPLPRPNVIVILADDLGYTDIGAYGSEIPTPNLDALADRGLKLTSFYASPTCSPTRAMLLTGVDNHFAGIGNMAELMATNQHGKPGYEGHLNDQVLTVAELIGASGYHTYMSGKWHLGLAEQQSPKARGFEKSFTLLLGGASHFSDMRGPFATQPKALYRENGELLNSLPENFYSSDYFTQKLIDYIDGSITDGAPFFGYLAFTAVHWPVQAPPEYLEKYRGHYLDGYEVLRKRRFERARQLGIIPESAILPPLHSAVIPWDDLSESKKLYEARLMQAYAAMVDNLDVNIGRLVSFLKKAGVYENTIIIFLSDNGAEGNRLSGPIFRDWVELHDNEIENIGKPNSFVSVGPGWAQASSVPFRLFKSYTSEGGLRVPAIIHWPSLAGLSSLDGGAVMTVRDITPTILDVAGVKHPGTQFNGRDLQPPSGRSILPFLKGRRSSVWKNNDVLAWELFGRRAVRRGAWKALYIEPPMGTGSWQLFNVDIDPGETTDLSGQRQGKLKSLIRAWEQYAESNNVILPVGPAGY